MDDITKGLRELIRVAMRERGIRHRSTSKVITSVCYAQMPSKSVEFEGPIKITYDLEHVTLVIRIYKSAQEVPYNNNQLSNCGYHRDIEFAEQVALAETCKIDIARPDMVDALGAILDKHVPDSIKRPRPHKMLITSYNGVDPYDYFVASKVVIKPKKTLYQIFREFVLTLLHADTKRQDFCWEQAVKRHFRIDDQELQELQQTVSHLQNLSHSEVRQNTETILRQ